jgi:hypothetical protein
MTHLHQSSITNFNSQLLTLATNIRGVSKQKKWSFEYDKEADSLSITEKNLPQNIAIKYLNNEIAVYITPNNVIRGIFIEYFTKNFLSHSEDLDDLKKELSQLRKNRTEDDELVQVKDNKINDLLDELQQDIKNLITSNFNLPHLNT